MCLLLTKVIMLFLGLHSTIFKRLTSILLFVYIQCSVTSYDSEDIITLILQQYFSEDGKRHDSYRYKIYKKIYHTNQNLAKTFIQ